MTAPIQMKTRFKNSGGIGLGKMNGGAAAPDFWATLKTGLVMALNLDETTGTRNDATGRGNNATMSGAVGYATGRVGNAAKVANYATDYLTVAYGTDLALGTNSWTMSAEIYPVSLAGWQTHISQTDYILWLDTDVSKFKFSSVQTAVSTVVCSINTWYHVVFGYNAGSGKLFISVNNETLVETTGTITDTSKALWLFHTGAGAGSAPNTLFDRVYRWNRILTNDELSALYEGGTPTHQYPT